MMKLIFAVVADRLLLAGRRGRSDGSVSVEYALLLALLVVAGIAAWASLGESLREALREVVDSFNETGV